MPLYNDDQMLMLSGIQHFVYCARQWALIQIYQVWEDNALTVEGSCQHKVVDNAEYRQLNGSTLTLRGLRIASYFLGLSGIADAIELYASSQEKGVWFDNYQGFYSPYPIEYKHGRKKQTDCDIVQLVAQAMCMEEMYGIEISEGAIFYRQTNRKMIVQITDELRQRVKFLADDMHRRFDNGEIPVESLQAKCRNCSLFNKCMPLPENSDDAKFYLKKHLYESTP